METDKKPKALFPYKTLIWALFACIALFLFKYELKQLLTNAEKLSVFGVEINASKEKVTRLQDSIQNFESTIADLSTQISEQQERISSLGELKTKLEQDLAECPEAKKTSLQFNKQVSSIFQTNMDLVSKSDKLRNASILKGQTYNVKLIVPSNMIKGDILVDGQKAEVIKRSGVSIFVKVYKKNGSHNFVIIRGTKRCTSDKLIEKDNTELAIVCDF